MKIFAGPFIGEFGWELSYWHAWLRFLKNIKYPNSKIIVSSYPGREQLYDFADEFIPLSNEFINKRYSQRAYFLDFKKTDISDLKADINNLYDYLRTRIPFKSYIHISCFPQKIKTTNFLYRVKKKINIFEKNIDPILEYNKFAGKFIDQPFHINFPYYENKYYPQYPDLNNQLFEELKYTNKSKLITDELLNQYNKKDVFTLFPRKRSVRRIDKNWGENKWKQLIKLLIDRYDPLIIICGTKDGSYFTNLKSTKNIFNSIGKEKGVSTLDLQISLIKKSNISLHGLSGSAILSLLCKKKTFMYGSDQEYKTICIEGNPLKTELMYYNDETLSPKPTQLFKKFVEFYEK